MVIYLLIETQKLALLGDNHYMNGVYLQNTNNNVIFGNYCWKIVRTTNTGGIKLIYNGVPSSDGSCNNDGSNSRLPSNSKFNDSKGISSAGYMRGVHYSFHNISFLSN